MRIGDGVTLEAGEHDGAGGRLAITAEGLFRLLYGRLDADHTPAGTTVTGPVGLDDLRRLFPGF